MNEQREKIVELRRRLDEVMARIEGVSPEQMTVDDIDHFINLLDQLEEKCR
ncbi:tetrahydromethanopterin S-methyltransferase subunit G [Salirhabdus euzebyi]|uniref:Tetrahydromethanopterin S-methyltransferase subunit G n=1 Tax=Salirhabdus euzebyi TaxID=394506 RepID=A0A841QAG3_9BACI|nr:SE1561 family protein [Salirhabdus euzebyi]MBB6455386.1 tetrahydromethanopterin S-methyltransferase subunit G [Salirhabdus euzebyi]